MVRTRHPRGKPRRRSTSPKSGVSVALAAARLAAHETGMYTGRDAAQFVHDDKKRLLAVSVAVYRVAGSCRCSFLSKICPDEAKRLAAQWGIDFNPSTPYA